VSNILVVKHDDVDAPGRLETERRLKRTFHLVCFVFVCTCTLAPRLVALLLVIRARNPSAQACDPFFSGLKADMPLSVLWQFVMGKLLTAFAISREEMMDLSRNDSSKQGLLAC
jgi:hypothetical protein